MTQTENDENWVMARKSRHHGLQPLRNALHDTGDVQNKLHFIHVAGTNGKGSTCAFLMEILTSCGIRTGMFTSPHLVCHNDRIRIGHQWIPHDTFTKLLKKLLPVIEKYDLGMFEIDFLIALHWFVEEGVDTAIIEAGIGGRDDSTNVIPVPDLAIITTISYDHMQILGSRISQIAFAKAGILKPYGHGLCGTDDPHARAVISAYAHQQHCALTYTKPWYDRGRQAFSFDHDTFHLSMPAQYQKANAALALQAAFLLGINIHTPAVHQAIQQTQWAGRFEVISTHPCIIVDGAHNIEGMEALCRTLAVMPGPKTAVFSALRDKPGYQMAVMLKKVCDQLIITSFQDDRADSLQELAVPGAILIPDPAKAIACAKEQRKNEGFVIAAGSLHFISLVRNMVLPEP
ncbi:MAG: Mur ligase family protein [Lactimicrobium sp.]|uniref:bifunctional folylpolyglutamate synthase/dihydrofolate synthase n=1 Tax=Lactimicrobium sp. TaxID=2563780 RepID=UPI002F3564DC